VHGDLTSDTSSDDTFGLREFRGVGLAMLRDIRGIRGIRETRLSVFSRQQNLLGRRSNSTTVLL